MTWHLTPKELARADEYNGRRFTVIARPQQDGCYLVIAIDVATCEPVAESPLARQVVTAKRYIPVAVRVVNRDLNKFMGLDTRMTTQGRLHRSKTP